jgi:acyl carrier protein
MSAGDCLRQRLIDGSETDRTRLLLEMVRSTVATVLGQEDAELVPAGQAFEELGFDSLTAVELADRLGAATGLRLTGTLVFDYPTPKALAEYLRAELLGSELKKYAVDSALAAIETLELALSSVALDDGAAEEITERLQVLLSRWGRTRRAAAGSPDSADLGSASADEIFDIIRNEFGKS